MRQTRLPFFMALFAATIALAAIVRRRGGPGGADGMLEALGVVGAAWAAAVVGDVAWHAWKGEGQACRRCGHVRPMKSFLPVGPCPKFGR